MRGYPDGRDLLLIAERANPPADIERGEHRDVAFDAGSGWQVVIFYDGGELDYIDHFVTPDGREINFWDWDERNPDRRVLIAWRGTGDLQRLSHYLEPPTLERVARELCWLEGQDPDNGDEKTWRDFVQSAQAWLDEETVA